MRRTEGTIELLPVYSRRRRPRPLALAISCPWQRIPHRTTRSLLFWHCWGGQPLPIDMFSRLRLTCCKKKHQIIYFFLLLLRVLGQTHAFS